MLLWGWSPKGGEEEENDCDSEGERKRSISISIISREVEGGTEVDHMSATRLILIIPVLVAILSDYDRTKADY